MLGLKIGLFLMMIYGGVLTGIACVMVIGEGRWSDHSSHIFALSMLCIIFDILVLRILRTRGLLK